MLSSDVRVVGICAGVPRYRWSNLDYLLLTAKFSFSAHYHGTATDIFDTRSFKVSTGLDTDRKGFDLH